MNGGAETGGDAYHVGDVRILRRPERPPLLYRAGGRGERYDGVSNVPH